MDVWPSRTWMVFGCTPSLKPDRDRCVSQTMEREPWVQADPLDRRRPDPAVEVRPAEQRAFGTREQQIVDRGECLDVLAQHVHQEGG
jgi:hypothetical protein